MILELLGLKNPYTFSLKWLQISLGYQEISSVFYNNAT